MTVESLRSHFPILSEKIPGGGLVYLDNAATSQRPLEVVSAYSELSLHRNANIHRAVHYLSNVATKEYEDARDAVKNFIGAASREEIIFTSGATASINAVAFSFGEAFVREGDEIILTEEEHHSNIVPWQMMASRKGATIKVLPVDDRGELRVEMLRELISPRTRILALSHVSNVLGLVNPIKEIIAEAHSRGVRVLVDGAQGIVHQKVDVQDLDCDFYVFSGHKFYAAPFTGVLYGRKDLLEAMPPYMGGGEMIDSVSLTRGTTYAPLPAKFEAGTQNLAGAPTLKAAIDFMKEAESPEIRSNLLDIRDYIYDALTSDKRIRLYGTPESRENKIPLFSFTVEGAHHEDIALILDKMGIAVRSGQMCAEPLMDRFGVSGMLRASFAPYNTLDEAKYFIESLGRAINMLI